MSRASCPACLASNEPLSPERRHEVRAAFSDEVAALDLPMLWVEALRDSGAGTLRVFFRSPDRVDFRELVPRLRVRLGERVELWRLDDRHVAGLVGGLGRCGRELCCGSWLETPGQVPVSSLGGRRVRGNTDCGVCGRLRCCLRYEGSPEAAEPAASDG